MSNEDTHADRLDPIVGKRLVRAPICMNFHGVVLRLCFTLRMEPTLDEVRAILSTSPRVAILGGNDDPSKPAFYVPDYLRQHGYTVFAVNPKLAGQSLFDAPVYGDLAALAAAQRPIDLLDVFRRPELLPAHLEEMLALKPRTVWFQQGIRNDAVAAELRAAGINVVQDRCTLADHRRFGLGAPTSVGE
jgi:hypothetical protein